VAKYFYSKTFVYKIFFGTVISSRTYGADRRILFQIAYDDGDSEDVYTVELNSLLSLYDKWAHVDVNNETDNVTVNVNDTDDSCMKASADNASSQPSSAVCIDGGADNGIDNDGSLIKASTDQTLGPSSFDGADNDGNRVKVSADQIPLHPSAAVGVEGRTNAVAENDDNLAQESPNQASYLSSAVGAEGEDMPSTRPGEKNDKKLRRMVKELNQEVLELRVQVTQVHLELHDFRNEVRGYFQR